jgi:hypothetical protein
LDRFPLTNLSVGWLIPSIPLKWLLPPAFGTSEFTQAFRRHFSPDGTAQGLWVERGII